MPCSYASSNFSRPFVKSPNVAAAKIRLAFLAFNCFATSMMLSPEEIISSKMITSFPSTESPKNSCATIGLRPSTIFV